MSWTRLTAAGGLLSYALSASGAGFAIIEASVPGLGNAFAGGAASAEDATTIFFNPAGMTRIAGTQAIGAVHAIYPSAKFDNNGSSVTTTGFASEPIRGSDGGDAGQTIFIPNFYYKRDFFDARLQFGLGVNAPFGLKTLYDSDWVGRYHAIKSDLKTVNINPSIAAKVWRGLSVGAGVSALYGEARLTRKLDACASRTARTFFGTQPGECDLLVDLDDADDWTFGGNVGLLYEFTENTRVGAHFRSKTKLELEGNAKFVYNDSTPGPLEQGLKASGLRDTNAEADLKLPYTVSMSGYHAFNDKIAIMADATWTKWNRLDEVVIKFDNNAPDETIDFDWQNAWRLALGATYTTDRNLILRVGVAYDESPVKGRQERSPRVPDNDRYWISAGLTWPASDNLRLDVAYAHISFKDAKIDRDQVTESFSVVHNLKGEYDSHANLFSAQLTYNFN